ncbi:maleate cis-trans isomerase family protein [Marivita hallyeonensis]|uniref:Maleate isomerase n=1 Tax=Marivita hallyeonensis TaxID=996342 RepID=A0A1M5LRK8_9RHOB|nr:aspartate/glutamate racemase family protein [Marivita hallyeonensis]SHG67782.1 maleate isomerase [Marivita hallyeonensis]
MGVEYGRAGLWGVLTPQANTTVEPELWALLPPGQSLINARLVSTRPTIEERLVDYTTRFEETAKRFANAPVTCIAAACTGASYLIGADREAEIVGEMQSRFGVPFLTAALATVAALRAMKAKRIALLTPYPETLNKPCIPYWESFGFDVVAKAGPALESAAFHPIYAMAGSGVFASYQELSDTEADAVLMLGTGMATLGPILEGLDKGLKPAVSCNLALAWAAAQQNSWDSLREDSFGDWRKAIHWRQRYQALFPEQN